MLLADDLPIKTLWVVNLNVINPPIFLRRGKMGTVGAVAVDVHGNVASATSTGGILNKMEGRVGDTPCVGRTRFKSWTGQNRFILCEISALYVH